LVAIRDELFCIMKKEFKQMGRWRGSLSHELVRKPIARPIILEANNRADHVRSSGCSALKPYYEQDGITIYNADCMAILEQLDNCSVDLILTDPPYGKTNCKWDSVIPLKPMWKELNRIIKPNGAIVITAAQPFTSFLITSNIKMFKYCWVWEKPSAKGHFNAKKRPMVAHEDVVVFYAKQPTYNPQMTHGHVRKVATKDKKLNSEVYNNNTKTVSYDSTSRYPRSIQIVKQETQTSNLHPTQKPLALMEYFIKTYTNVGDKILDFAIGSGTTLKAAQELGREAIGIDVKIEYCNITIKRLTKPRL
jgi:site-specific DNA-methyltransferase (adenine-specific)